MSDAEKSELKSTCRLVENHCRSLGKGHTMNTWKEKAHRVINDLCRQSYLKSNRLPDGTLRKRHVPYSIPQEAQDLIRCLKDNDEVGAKEMFLNNYRISKLEEN